MRAHHVLFDWGDTLMVDLPDQTGAMCDWPKVEAVPGALDCLRRLHTKVVCHIATNARDSDPQQVRQALERVGLSAYIDTIFCYKTLGYDKANPAFYKAIIEALQVNPWQITMVGDSLSKDIYPAMAQGLNTIWYNPQQLPCPAAILSVSHLADLVL